METAFPLDNELENTSSSPVFISLSSTSPGASEPKGRNLCFKSSLGYCCRGGFCSKGAVEWGESDVTSCVGITGWADTTIWRAIGFGAMEPQRNSVSGLWIMTETVYLHRGSW